MNVQMAGSQTIFVSVVPIGVVAQGEPLHARKEKDQ